MAGTGPPDQVGEARHQEDSRIGSLTRIRALTDASAPSQQTLLDIINDASTVLAQYERSPTFLWPLRMTFLVIHTPSGWRIQQLHWSWPGRGFPPVRLFPNELATDEETERGREEERRKR